MNFNPCYNSTTPLFRDVGFYISFYLFVPIDGLYLMAEIYSFETAKYLGELPHLLSTFDSLKQVMICSRNNYVSVHAGETRRRGCSLHKPELDRIINTKKPRGLSSSLSFKK